MNDVAPRATSAPLRAAVGALLLIALMLSVLLLWGSVGESGHVPGCGEASGCDRVLATRWAYWFALPVSAVAVMHYVVMLAALVLTRGTQPPRVRRIAWLILFTFSVAGASAAAWFIGVQYVALKQWCVYCTTAHGCALLAALLIWCCRPWRGEPISARERVACVIIGLALVGVLIVGQLRAEPPSFHIDTAPAGADIDSGPGPDRRMSVYGGRIRFNPHELPLLGSPGSPDAPVVILSLYDYTCGHCRVLHAMLESARQRYGERLAVVMLPVPMHADCNPLVKENRPGTEHACELARIALAVWHADAAKFAAMDAWLMQDDALPTPDAAHAHAIELIGAEALERALADPAIDDRIAGNVGLYGSFTQRTVPMLIAGRSILLGSPPEIQKLYDFLEDARPELADESIQSAD